MAENTIRWNRDADGIVTLTLDDPTGSVNVMNEHYRASMRRAVERLDAEKDSITPRPVQPLFHRRTAP